VLSIIALFAALGGVSYGLAGKNTVTSDDIANGAVKSKDIKNSGVKSKDLNTGSVKSSDVADDGLTGDDINENTLGKVNRASEADRAAKADNADNADNADALGGSPAGAFVQATNFAYGEINPSGPAVKSDPPNKNINSVTNPSTGLYCFDLAFTPTFAQGSGTGASTLGLIVQPDIPATNCPGADASVYLSDDTGTFVNDDFQVLFGSF
jgi:hypothetical protein